MQGLNICLHLQKTWTFTFVSLYWSYYYSQPSAFITVLLSMTEPQVFATKQSTAMNQSIEFQSFLCRFSFLDNSDLTVDCGTTVITLEVNLCSAKWAGFNATDLALNGNHNISNCLGSVDTSVDPPVVRYQLPVNHSQDNSCRQSLQVREGQGETPKHRRQTGVTNICIFVLFYSDCG